MTFLFVRIHDRLSVSIYRTSRKPLYLSDSAELFGGLCGRELRSYRYSCYNQATTGWLIILPLVFKQPPSKLIG